MNCISDCEITQILISEVLALRGYFAAQVGIYLPTTNLHEVTTSIKPRLTTDIWQFLYIFGAGGKSGNECTRTCVTAGSLRNQI